MTWEEIRQLSVAERIQLVEDIWDSIAINGETLDLTTAQRDELDSRLDSYEKKPSEGTAWVDVKARLQSHHDA